MPWSGCASNVEFNCTIVYHSHKYIVTKMLMCVSYIDCNKIDKKSYIWSEMVESNCKSYGLILKPVNYVLFGFKLKTSILGLLWSYLSESITSGIWNYILIFVCYLLIGNYRIIIQFKENHYVLFSFKFYLAERISANKNTKPTNNINETKYIKGLISSVHWKDRHRG